MYKINGMHVKYKQLNRILKTLSDNYKALPTQTAQQVLILLEKNWKSFYEARKEYKIHPDNFLGKPGPPKYKPKNGQNILIFTNQQANIKNNIIKFPKKTGIREVRTRLSDKTKLRQVRIIPRGTGYVCEIVYDKTLNPPTTNPDRILGIDLNSSNIMTIGNNIGLAPIVIKDDGTGIKSINQYYHKKNAQFNYLYYTKQHLTHTPKRMLQLENKYLNKSKNSIHQLTSKIIKYAVHHNIGTIVIGHNIDWKQCINLGNTL